MDEDDVWFRGMAVAAFTLQVHTFNKLRELGLLGAQSTKDIIDAALLDLETRDANIPEKHRVTNARARAHPGNSASDVTN